MSELTAQFDSSASSNISEFISLLPTSVSSSLSVTVSLQALRQFYEDDLLCALDAELLLWRGKWKADATLGASLDTPMKALAHTDGDIFPNIQVLLHIMATLPVTSCECERSISMMRLVKSQLRTTMGQTRLNSLALLYYHHDIQLTPEEVVEEFACRHPRRMTLLHPLD